MFDEAMAGIALAEIGGQAFCEGCNYSNGESCMKIVPPEVELDTDGEIVFYTSSVY